MSNISKSSDMTSNQIDRKIFYIDVGKMSEQEICSLIGVKYTPWYKSTIFWGIFLLFASHFLLILATLIK